MRLLALALAVIGLAVCPASAQPSKTAHMTAELVAQSRGVAPGGVVVAALRLDLQPGWHTYWKNPGDAGAPPDLQWILPAGWTMGDLVWAPPHRQPTGPLVSYGYQGQVLLPFRVTAPAGAQPGQSVAIQARGEILVCSDVCVPEAVDLTLTLPVTATPTPDSVWAAPIAQALSAAPRAAGLSSVFASSDAGLKLAVTGPALSGAKAGDAYFYSSTPDQIDPGKPQTVARGPDGLTLTLTRSALLTSPPQALAGVLELDGRAYEISAAPGALPAGAAPVPKAAPGGALRLAAAIGFAVLGGLILNLMPCVFPILAMKAASLAGHGDAHGEARAQGLAFLAGCVATFVGLAAILIAVRAAGQAVGWGFQLQSPPVVAGLALLMLAVALNLSGVFEVGTSLQGLGGQAAARGGISGAFFTGALAVVVAAPCTAPFMGPALGWALTQDPLSALAVFAGLGVGFAAPFTAAALSPALLSRLPRPGAWMDGFRSLMSFPMYGAAAWLAWVLAVQSDTTGLARLLGAAVVLAMGVWLLGVAQRRQATGASPRVAAVMGAVLTLLAAGAAVGPTYAATAGARSEAGVVASEPYSPERLAEAQAAGHPVFVNYTAAWCVTCQVNEKVAFSTKAAADAFARTGAVYLKADWTRKDAVIAADLARHGRAGVPLYLVYGAKGGEPAVLPQLLTAGVVAQALEAAARN